MSKTRKTTQYGRIAIGQLVRYSASILAPTNSTRPCGCMRDQATRKIIHPDETICFSADGFITNLTPTETGCMAVVTLCNGGQLSLHINRFGQSPANFRGLHILRDAPTQMELAA
jgi:hypothetical protein